MTADALLESSAQRIAAAFAAYNGEFRAITRRAKSRFEARDWHGSQQDAVERIDLYDKSVNRLVEGMRAHLGERSQDRHLWQGIRNRFHSRTAGLPDAAFARTFFSSVSRRSLGTVGVAPELEFTGEDLDPLEGAGANPEVTEYGFRGDLQLLFEDLLGDLDLRCPWINFDRSVEHAVQDIEAALNRRPERPRLLHIKILRPIFFQSTRAYIVGHLATEAEILPLVIALQHTERGLFIDAVMLDEDDISIVFGFTRSYFHVDLERVVDPEREAPVGKFAVTSFEPPVARVVGSAGDGHVAIEIDFKAIDALAADNPGSPLFEWEQRRDMRRWKAFDLEIATDSEACPSLRLRVRNK